MDASNEIDTSNEINASSEIDTKKEIDIITPLPLTHQLSPRAGWQCDKY
jgi:hypothetical protein